jgi:positive regulator of sigma E activity
MKAGASRTALVALIFSLTPLGGLLVLQRLTKSLGGAYALSIPLGIANVIAAWALVNQSRRSRLSPTGT